ncbi:unnamed protein product, partial [Scytosiphon promiscuus]
GGGGGGGAGDDRRAAEPAGARGAEGEGVQRGAEAARGAPGSEGEARGQERPIQLGGPEDEGRRRESHGGPQGEHPAARTPRHVETQRCFSRGCFRRGRRRQRFQEEEEVFQRKGVEGGGGRGLHLRRSLPGEWFGPDRS